MKRSQKLFLGVKLEIDFETNCNAAYFMLE